MKTNLGMTGEITLRGAVLPIGGVREKVMAAHRAGLSTVILPAKNERDLVELPDNVKRKMNFQFVEEISQVFDLALETLEETAKTTKRSAKKKKVSSQEVAQA